MVANTSMRPHSGTTRRLWDIADELTRATGRIAKRKEVIERFVSEGGNANTASTQFHHWKSAQAQPEELRRFGPMRLVIGTDGRVVIPAEMRRAMRLGENGIITAEVRDGELSMMAPEVALKRIQEMLKPLKEKDSSVVDEFLSERKALWGDDV